MKPQAMFSWMHPSLEIRETDCYGKGVFARTALAKDEILLVMGGYILTIDDENHLTGIVADKPIELPDRFSIGPRNPDDLARMPQHWINHSCDPNCGFKGQIFLVALRDIATNEEIAYDYAMVMNSSPDSDSNFSMACHCGSPLCGRPIWSQQVYAKAYKLAPRPEQKTAPETQRLKGVLSQLKSYYRVDILFEGGLVDGLVVPTDLVDYKASLESNLEKVLKVSGLNFKKVKEGAYVILDAKKPKKTAEADARFQESIMAPQLTEKPLMTEVSVARAVEKMEILAPSSLKGKCPTTKA